MGSKVSSLSLIYLYSSYFEHFPSATIAISLNMTEQGCISPVLSLMLVLKVATAKILSVKEFFLTSRKTLEMLRKEKIKENVREM